MADSTENAVIGSLQILNERIKPLISKLERSGIVLSKSYNTQSLRGGQAQWTTQQFNQSSGFGQKSLNITPDSNAVIDLDNMYVQFRVKIQDSAGDAINKTANLLEGISYDEIRSNTAAFVPESASTNSVGNAKYPVIFNKLALIQQADFSISGNVQSTQFDFQGEYTHQELLKKIFMTNTCSNLDTDCTAIMPSCPTKATPYSTMLTDHVVSVYRTNDHSDALAYDVFIKLTTPFNHMNYFGGNENILITIVMSPESTINTRAFYGPYYDSTTASTKGRLRYDATGNVDAISTLKIEILSTNLLYKNLINSSLGNILLTSSKILGAIPKPYIRFNRLNEQFNALGTGTTGSLFGRSLNFRYTSTEIPLAFVLMFRRNRTFSAGVGRISNNNTAGLQKGDLFTLAPVNGVQSTLNITSPFTQTYQYPSRFVEMCDFDKENASAKEMYNFYMKLAGGEMSKKKVTFSQFCTSYPMYVYPYTQSFTAGRDVIAKDVALPRYNAQITVKLPATAPSYMSTTELDRSINQYELIMYALIQEATLTSVSEGTMFQYQPGNSVDFVDMGGPVTYKLQEAGIAPRDIVL